MGENEVASIPKKIARFSQREVLWFWGRVSNLGYALNPNLIYPKELALDHVWPLMRGINPNYDVDKIVADKENCLLPSSEFDWIGDNDRRALNWILASRNLYNIYEPPFLNNPSISKKDRFVASIDLLNVDLIEKSRVAMNVRSHWAAIISQDKIYDWIDKRNDEQCRWIWERINDEKVFVFLDPDIANPIDAADCYFSFFATLDRSTLHPAEKELLSGKLKRKWARFKQKKKKVQANYQIDAQKKLWVEEMADNKGLRKGEFIEKLIADAYTAFKEKKK